MRNDTELDEPAYGIRIDFYGDIAAAAASGAAIEGAPALVNEGLAAAAAAFWKVAILSSPPNI